VTALPEVGCWGAVWNGTPFTSEQLRFRSLVEADLPHLAELAGDSAITCWAAPVPHPFSEENGRAFLEHAGAENRIVLGLETGATREFIGYLRIDITDGVGDIAYWIGRPYWGRGFGGEALKRATRFAFEDLNVNALDVEVIVGNAAAERVLEKAGYAKTEQVLGVTGRCDGILAVQYHLDRVVWMARQAAKPTLLVVAVAMVDPDGRVLMAKRPEGKKMAGLWEFPGGKVDKGESLEAALIRELKEEIGVDTRESCLAAYTFASHEYEDFRLLMPLYVCRVWKGTPQAQEGQELAWVRPQRMRDYPMPPADAPLIALLCDLL
tara:strand:- start:34055 stop:35023 length:969 start_codon:yes stop_codon:yes gene_type:complete